MSTRSILTLKSRKSVIRLMSTERRVLESIRRCQDQFALGSTYAGLELRTRIPPGQLARDLLRMINHGWLERDIIGGDLDMPSMPLFRITDSGRTALENSNGHTTGDRYV